MRGAGVRGKGMRGREIQPTFVFSPFRSICFYFNYGTRWSVANVGNILQKRKM